ncbi:MAG: type IV pilus biogenesis protein PilM [Candidatus Methylomirabilales bacterium]
MRGTWGLEIDTGRIGLCQIRQTSHGVELTRGASQPLPPNLVTPSLTESNIADEQECVSQLRSLLHEVGWKGGTVAVALPDLTCRTGFQDFEELKGHRSEIRQILCWRLKDRLPFPVHEARIDYQVMPTQGNGSRLLYLLAREGVIAQYESLLATVGLEPTRVITRGAALYRFHHLGGISGKRLFLALGPSSIVLVYAEEGIPRLWRVLPCNGHGDPHDATHQARRVIRELQETLSYLRDEMGVERPDDLFLSGRSHESVAESLTKAYQVPVHTAPEPHDGLPVDLLAPTGAALLHKTWRLEWILPSTWPRPRR